MLTCDGLPDADRDTVEEKLPTGMAVSVAVPVYPC